MTSPTLEIIKNEYPQALASLELSKTNATQLYQIGTLIHSEFIRGVDSEISIKFHYKIYKDPDDVTNTEGDIHSSKVVTGSLLLVNKNGQMFTSSNPSYPNYTAITLKRRLLSFGYSFKKLEKGDIDLLNCFSGLLRKTFLFITFDGDRAKNVISLQEASIHSNRKNYEKKRRFEPHLEE